MKKFLLFFTLSALTFIYSNADTLSFGPYDDIEVEGDYSSFPTQDGSSWECSPLDFSSTFSGSQILYLKTELGNMASGKITAINLKYYDEGSYIETQMKLKVYVSETGANEFFKDDSTNRYRYFDIEDATLVYDGTIAHDGFSFSYMVAPEINLKFSKPYEYTGEKNLVFTFIADDNENPTDNAHYINFFESANQKKRSITYNSRTVSFADELKNNEYAQRYGVSVMNAPVLQFVYQMDAKEEVLTLGNFDGSDEKERYDGFNKQNAPIVMVYSNSGTQNLYHPELISKMAGKDIKSIAFSYQNESYESYSSTIKVYLTEVSETAFRVNENNKTLWFDVDENNLVATKDYSIDMYETWGENETIKIDLDKPYRYKGNTLVITVVNESESYIDPSYNIVNFNYINGSNNPIKRPTYVFASDATTFFNNLQANNSIVTLSDESRTEAPAIQFTYSAGSGINLPAIDNIKTDDAWYTITGIRISRPTSAGIYIHNGKKSIIK